MSCSVIVLIEERKAKANGKNYSLQIYIQGCGAIRRTFQIAAERETLKRRTI